MLHLALNHPERIKRLVLGCTTAGGQSLSIQTNSDRFLVQPQLSGDPRDDFYSGLWMSVSDGEQDESSPIWSTRWRKNLDE